MSAGAKGRSSSRSDPVGTAAWRISPLRVSVKYMVRLSGEKAIEFGQRMPSSSSLAKPVGST
ncbi:MAG: hypothetical protein R3C69_08695 [Geminicoccaceae bacterium]